MTAGALVASGWWFVRNEVIYGDLTGITGLRRWGWPVHSGSLDTLGQILNRASYFAVSYASPQPTFGGSFRTPPAAKAVFSVLALAALAGLARYFLARGPAKIRVERTAVVTFALALVTSIAANVYSYLTILIADPRTTFASFFVVACAGALGVAALSERWRPGVSVTVVVAALLVADVTTLQATRGIPRPPLRQAIQGVETPR
jgi:4-amino-4-deoxy-L-arabinose transferase-like glycosyltransferase